LTTKRLSVNNAVQPVGLNPNEEQSMTKTLIIAAALLAFAGVSTAEAASFPAANSYQVAANTATVAKKALTKKTKKAKKPHKSPFKPKKTA